MAVIKKTDLENLDDAARAAKISELERAILELRGEGRKDKVKPLRKAIAKLKTPFSKRVKKSER
ncbi:MAG: hypothetical protein ABH842_00035 [Candidatus Micrarchaeota archaeon]